MFAGCSIQCPPASRTAEYWLDFGPFDCRVWLNSAHQGPLPKVAAEAACRAVEQKSRPFLIRNEDFFLVPVRLRTALGKLINANPDDVILGNSATFGLDLLANGIPWQNGDEVLLVEGDYPANVYPWLVARGQGVTVRFINTNAVIEPSRLAREISSRTRLFCTSWVNPFTGSAIDVTGIANTCASRRVRLVLNASQALGARVLDVNSSAIDALTCTGSKWLCGPYGTGFCWIRPVLRESLVLRHGYWLAMMAGQAPDQIRDYALRADLGARAWDVFCTANFLNFIPWTASIEYLLEAGPANVACYDDRLVTRLLQGIDPDLFEIASPACGPQRSTIVNLRPKKAGDVEAYGERLTALGLDIAVGAGTVRISPHLNNSPADIDRLLRALAPPRP